MEQQNPQEIPWCFECHKNNSGHLQKCANCSRCYHPKCAKDDQQREQDIEKWNYHKANFQKTLTEGAARKPGNNTERERTKSPDTDENCNESDMKLCYACTLLEKGKQLPEVQLSREEINYLLKFVVDRVISWVPDNAWGVAQIKEKIANQSYTLLEELLVDILDMVHDAALTEGCK